MAFLIRMGQPEMESLWLDLTTRKQQGKLDKDEEKFFKKLVKALGYLQENPRHNSLASHEIGDLTRKYGLKISSRIWKTTLRQPDACSGPTGRTRGTSPCWPSSRTRRIRSAAHTNASSCPRFPLPSPSLTGRADGAWKKQSKVTFQ